MKFSRFFRRGRDIAQESSVPVLSRGRGQRWKNIRLALIVVIAVGVSEYKSVLRHGGRIVSQFVATRDYVTGHKVTDDLRICLTSPSSKQEVEQLCEQVRADYLAVREAFDVDVTGPIVVRFVEKPLEESEPGIVTTASFLPSSRASTGYDIIQVYHRESIAEGHVFSHEFSHLWISRINPEISLVLNEGIAHFVESLCYGKEHLYEELVLAAALPTERHWVAGTPKSNLGTYSLRGIGYAVVDYLFKVKRIPLREIPTLSDAQLPEVEEISRHLWDLKLEALKRQVVRTPSVNVAVNVDPQEWLVRTSWTPLNTDAGGTVGAAECWAELEARVRNGVRLLRTQGIDDAEILKVAPTELMKHGLPTLAEDCPSLYLETSLNVAGLMYQGSDGGLCNAALERLISDSYPQSQDSLLQRDCDQAWARVYASKSLDYKGELPEYSPALLEEIRAKVSEMSAVRTGMRAFQNASQQQDKL